ncbi:hypothetical protein N7481_007933 [Penicillium waksmanii]|uniref:uncharacterized protein n=1 Tax=Penicillium waksmanii TaxID=69791 RepID=UPI0025490055|nr:uncharacterized protein N7481_007933 [Penicillium waksmanii]KAJ5980635.1 hypothetical protein N7481_007933 [Penicillium waksmanii]
MTSVIASIKDLICSVFEVMFSTIKTAFDTVFSIFHALFTSIVSVFGILLNTAKDAVGAVGGVGKFIASNIFVLAFVGIGIYGFLNYRSRQGRPVKVGNKKLN